MNSKKAKRLRRELKADHGKRLYRMRYDEDGKAIGVQTDPKRQAYQKAKGR